MRHPCLKGKLSELSHFRAQQTKISYNVVFFNNVYCSEVDFILRQEGGFRPLGGHMLRHVTICLS